MRGRSGGEPADISDISFVSGMKAKEIIITGASFLHFLENKNDDLITTAQTLETFKGELKRHLFDMQNIK